MIVQISVTNQRQNWPVATVLHTGIQNTLQEHFPTKKTCRPRDPKQMKINKLAVDDCMFVIQTKYISYNKVPSSLQTNCLTGNVKSYILHLKQVNLPFMAGSQSPGQLSDTGVNSGRKKNQIQVSTVTTGLVTYVEEWPKRKCRRGWGVKGYRWFELCVRCLRQTSECGAKMTSGRVNREFKQV